MSMNLSVAGVVLPTAVATYVLVGIDEVGMEIENAFRLLPLQQLAAAAQNGVRDQIVPASGPMPEDEF
jgi:predicted membrane chloride channel (bestrophin family)